MSSSKGSSSSSKTAHVMNLLRKSAPPDAAPAEGSDEQPAAAPAASAGQIPPILSSLNADAQISAEIKDALEQALDAEIAADTAAQAPVPTQQSEGIVPPSEPVSTQQDESSVPRSELEPEQPTAAPAAAAIPPVQEPVQESQPVPEPTQEDPIPEEPAPEEPVPEEPAPEEPTPQSPVSNAEEQNADVPTETDARAPVLVNVMRQLAEERADKYIDLFGLCSCQHCRGDVIALTLNRLSPKYVVMSPTELTARMDMYGNRFNSEITAQILRACKEVMDHPRHSD